MTFKPGLYLTSHENCSIYVAHRHPTYVTGPGGQRTPQPRTVQIEVPAQVTFEVMVDVDRTARVRSASYLVDENDIFEAVVSEVYQAADQLITEHGEQDPEVTGAYAEADAARERVLEVVVAVRDGECAVGEGWLYQWPAPVLDEAVEL